MKKNKLLIVDDDPVLLHVTEQLLLKRLDCEVYCANSTIEGLDLALQHLPDIIVSDLRMPGEDGIVFCQKAKAHPLLRSTLFVLLTAVSDTEHKTQGLDLGADDYIAKPYSAVEFIARINALLRIKKLQDVLADERNDLKKMHDTMRQSFDGIVNLLTRLIELKVPSAAIRGQEAACMVLWIGNKLEISPESLSLLEFASKIHEIGKIVPDPIQQSSLSQKDIPTYGEALIKGIVQLSPIDKWLRHGMENFDGSGFPDKLMHNEISIYSRILRAVYFYEEEYAKETFSDELQKATGTLLDPVVATLLREYLLIHHSESWLEGKLQIRLDELCAGMKIAMDLYTSKGVKLLTKDTIVSSHQVAHILSHHQYDPILQGIYIYQ